MEFHAESEKSQFCIAVHIIENSYLFTCHHIEKRSAHPHEETRSVLHSNHHIIHVDQQRVLSRKKRDGKSREVRRLDTAPTLPRKNYDDPFQLNDYR